MAIISFEGEKLGKMAESEILAIGEILALLADLPEYQSAERVMAYVNHYVGSKRPIVTKNV